VANGQQVTQGIVRADRVGGIALKALRDQDRDHLQGDREVQRDRDLAYRDHRWVLSASSTAE